MLTLERADWAAARAAVSTAASRVGNLVREVKRPEAPALGSWTVADVAIHLSHTVDALTAMAQGGGGLLEDISGLSSMTQALVRGESRRDLAQVGERIEANAARFVEMMERAPGDELRTWLVRGTQLPLSSLTCHMLNDLLIHGRDIAVVEGVPWPIRRTHAALIISGFLFPALSALGSQMVNQQAAAGVRACFDIRLRGGGGRVFWCFDDGNLSVEPPSSRPVDCHLWVDPTAYLLVAWGRINQLTAIARGQLLAWGRRPWLAPKLRSLVRNP